MRDQIDRIPALGLVLDHGRHRGSREPGQAVELGGSVRLWELLVALGKRHDRYFRTYDLISEVWGDYPAAESTLWAAVSELRKMLGPLQVTIKHRKGIGYRLEDLRTRES
jgi:DNA-binding response OmpR family regulator